MLKIVQNVSTTSKTPGLTNMDTSSLTNKGLLQMTNSEGQSLFVKHTQSENASGTAIREPQDAVTDFKYDSADLEAADKPYGSVNEVVKKSNTQKPSRKKNKITALEMTDSLSEEL